MSVFPVAPGHPDYSSSGTSKYTPEIYSALLIKKFYPTTVWGEISNTAYEGDIKSQGDTVNIRTRPTIETFKYKKGMILPIQNPTNPYITLKITQGEGFSFALDKVDEFQSDLPLMSTWAEDGSEQMKQVIDRNSLACVAAAAAGNVTSYTGYDVADNPITSGLHTGNAGQTLLVQGGATVKGTISASGYAAAANSAWSGLGPVSGNTVSIGTMATSATGYAAAGDWIVDRVLYYGQLLDENNVPDGERFVVMPTWMIQRMKSVQSKLGQAYVTGDSTTPTRSGKIGSIDRFKIIASNNLPDVAGAYPVIFGHKYALTFATQMTESRIIDNPYAFGKMMQALQIYGFNIIKPGFIGVDFLKQ